jgi:crotonobetaine/carnitine-CoA ligase
VTPTLAGRWSAAVRAVPERTFLLWEAPDERVTTWTYGAFDALVRRTSEGLQARGVGAGDAVHLVLTNSPAFVATWLGALSMGAWVVPADPSATAIEIESQLGRTGSRLVVAGSRAAEVAGLAAKPTGTTVVVVDEDDVTLDALAPPGGASGATKPARKPAPLDRAAVLFTSGTTSRPKGVEITQANYAFAGDVMAAAAALTSADRCLVVLPLFHANAQYYSFAAAISVGASVALAPAFSATRFLAQAARLEATTASLFAAPMRMILAKQPTPEPGLRLRHCWFAQSVSDDQYEQLSTLLGCRPRQLYGMTETLPAVMSDRSLDPVPASIGRPTLGCTVELHDADGRRVPDPDDGAPGEVGEIVVGGRRGIELLAGYLDDPSTTDAAFRDGWFHTGDRAYVDVDGRWRFVGRGADVLKVAGENVSCVEIEGVLGAHPDVLEAAVVGRPDAMRDEVPVAFVVAAPGVGVLDVELLRAWAEARLAKSKRPHRYHVIESLPRTSVGKIRKFELQDPA